MMLARLSLAPLPAQDAVLSQYQAIPSAHNPALVGQSKDIAVRLHYRQQALLNATLSTAWLSFSYPFLRAQTGQPWGSVGVSFFYQSQAEILETQGFILGGAYRLDLPRDELYFGLQGGVFQQGLGSGNFTTGSQFDPSLGFLPSQALQENLPFQKHTFGVVSTGLHWKHEQRSGVEQFSLGLSVFNWNRPNMSWDLGNSSSQARLPISWVLSGSGLLFARKSFQIRPQIRWVSRLDFQYLYLGSWWEYHFHTFSSFWESGRLRLGIWYYNQEQLISTLEWKINSFRLSISHDLLLSQRAQEVLGAGAWEFGLGIFFSKTKSSKSSSKDAFTFPKLTILSGLGADSLLPHTNLPAKSVAKLEAPPPRQSQPDSSTLGLELTAFRMQISFRPEQPLLDQKARQKLDHLSTTLQGLRTPKVLWLQGQIQATADPEQDQRRARAVCQEIKNYLMRQGISESQIQISARHTRLPLENPYLNVELGFQE